MPRLKRFARENDKKGSGHEQRQSIYSHRTPHHTRACRSWEQRRILTALSTLERRHCVENASRVGVVSTSSHTVNVGNRFLPLTHI